jgi:hypothetical protein
MDAEHPTPVLADDPDCCDGDPEDIDGIGQPLTFGH